MTRSKRVRDPIYEACTGRSASPEAVKLREWIHKWSEAHTEALPSRFRFYEAVMAGVISKTMVHTVDRVTGDQVETKGDLLWKAALGWVRDNINPATGRPFVPESWIVDDSRTFNDYTGYASIAAGLADHVFGIPIDPWGEDWPLVLVESQASEFVLQTVSSRYRIQSAALKGQGGRGFLANRVAEKVHDGQTIFTITDLDKAGGDIAASAIGRLKKFTGYSFDVRPLALTEDQVTDYGIEKVPRIDKRFKPPLEYEVAETEGLGADGLRAVLTTALDALFIERGLDPLVAVLGRERAERRRWFRRFLEDDENAGE